MGKMRGIALVNALLKWYLATITLIMQRLLSNLEHTDTLIIGGEKGCAASLVYVPLQLLAQKAAEWSKDESIYVFDGDIFKAFDSLKPSHAIVALRDLGLHPAICAA